MKALIMAGGRGSRLGFIEKPLIKINNKFLIDYIIEEVKKSKIEDFYIATSLYTKKTENYLRAKYKNKLIKTPGKGFIEDINFCFKYFKEPFLVIASDLYGLNYKIIDRVIEEFFKLNVEALTVIKDNKPIGLNILTPKREVQKEKVFIIEDRVININTPEDLKKALSLEG
ncbi:NTP transferase domain-containing protein [Methanocaldococcus sp.]